MSIGSVPANSTKAGAVEFTLNMDILVWETTQITSWWPGAGAFVPGSSVATSFDLWFKFKLPKKFYEYYNTIGVTVQNIGNTGYQPSGTTDASLCMVTTEFDENLLWNAGRGQIYTLRNVDNYYYIQVKTPNQNRVAETQMKIHVDTFMRKVSVVGAIAVQDYQQRGAIVVANPNISFGPSGSADIAHIWIAEDAHSVGGTGGDVLINGYTCIQDSALAAGGVTIRSRNYRDPFSFSNLGTVPVISRNSAGTVFWFTVMQQDPTVGPGIVRSITVGPSGTSSAVLGPIISLPFHLVSSVFGSYITNRIAALRVHNDILYYSYSRSNTVYRWNLTTNSAMPVFIAEAAQGQFTNNPLYFGWVSDILVAPNGDVLVGFYSTENLDDEFPPFGSYKPFTVRRYNSAGTFLATYFNFDVNPPAHYRINYSEDPNFFYVWTHMSSSGYPSSMFYKVRLSDGIVDHYISAHEFLDGALMYTGSLYTGNRTPAQSWGTNQISNFWINPLDIAVPAIPPDPITPPPPGPGEPAPNPAGGGLLMLDPSNRIKHDIYMDKAGAQYNSTIMITISTAFLGD